MENIKSVSKRNLYILTALWGFVFGILFASLVRVPPLVCVLVILVAVTIYFAERHTIILIALCALALGALRFDIKDFHILAPAGSSGVVVSEPEQRDTDMRFVVKTDTGEKVLVSTDLFSNVKYGDFVTLSGIPKAPQPADYAKYLSKDDIYYVMNFAKITKTSEDNGFWLISNLLKIKSAFVEKMKQILPEPESSLLAGLVVAGKQALPKSIQDDFQHAGVIHVIVLSGYNITIIAEFMLLVFGFLGKRKAALASALGIILFTLMAGATATVLRAAIMILILLIGKIYGREGNSGRILLVTAVLMLLQNPKILVFDPSFQLSFLAMIALIYVAPILQSKLTGMKLIANSPTLDREQTISFKLVELLSVTLATQIVVFPYLLYNMGNFSTVFLFSNLLILFIVPYTMLIGFVATLLAFISTILAWPFAFISHLLLKYILFIAHFLGNLSFASIQIQNFPLWLTLLLYLVLGSILWRARSSPRTSPSLG